MIGINHDYKDDEIIYFSRQDGVLNAMISKINCTWWIANHDIRITLTQQHIL